MTDRKNDRPNADALAPPDRRRALAAGMGLAAASLLTRFLTNARALSAQGLPSPETTMPRRITFDRDGLTLVGHLFTPAKFDEARQYDAVIVQGSFSSVKEQMSGTYARKFAEQGFVALAFDYAHYGESAGEPRQLESPAEKLRDLQAAISYLTALPYVKAVGMVGVCTSAGNAAYLGAAEPRLKALATVAAFLPGPALFSLMYGADTVAQRKAAAAASRRKHETTGEMDVVPAYSEVDPSAINYGPAGSFDYYLNASRGKVPQYRNESALMGLEQFLEFDPVSQASRITTPTMVVHSDGSAFPDEAKKLYGALKGEKELVWSDGTHYDYYDSPAQIDNAVANVTRFFRTHLAA
jgi:fermentation-respiration switch protein FrsA (DUF1100 family)